MTLDSVDTGLRRLESAAMFAAGVALLAIVHIVVVDVVGRYIFNAPLPWAFDFISQYLLVVGFFLVVGPTLEKREHVAVDIFARMMGARWRNGLAALAHTAALLFVLIMLAEGLDEAWIAWRDQDLQVGILTWPTWTSKIFVPVGFAMLVARMILVILRHVILAARPPADEL